MKPHIHVNARILSAPMTGVQRYLSEIMKGFTSNLQVEVHTCDMRGIKGHLWEQISLPIKISNNELLFSPSNTGPLLKKRQVVTLHDLVSIDHPEWLNPKFAAWYQFLTPKLARSVRHVITVSNFSKSRILELTGIPDSKVSVIKNCVDSRFKPLTSESFAIQSKDLNLPSKKYFLALGSLEPRKNLPLLLQAWTNSQNDLPEDLWLVVAGKPGSSAIFRETILSSHVQRVFYTGHVPDSLLPALYGGAQAFLYLSVYEGFGLPPLEAMACGVPVLTGNLTALPEVVGDAGLMIDPFSVEEASNAMVKLANSSDLRNKLSLQGLRRAQEFNWCDSASQTEHILLNN